MQIKSLVTGGAGFIGSHIVNHLIEQGHQVVVLDDLSGGFIENIHPQAEFCKGSITDVFLVNGLFQEYQFDYVYHLAAYAAEGLSHFIRRFNYQNNLIGSINLINAAVNFNVKCFVFASSIAVYGDSDLLLNEQQTPKPIDPYGIAKYAVEMDLENARQLFGLNSIIFRPHNVYGSGQNIGDKYRNVVGIFMNQILKNEPLTIFGNGQQTRCFSHINDVAPYIANAVNIKEAQNKIFNIGGGQAYSINKLADEVITIMGKNTSKKFLSARHEAIQANADHTEFNTVFKPAKSMNLKTGLQEMANWVQKKGALKSTSFSAIEINKNMPESWKKNH